MEEEANSPPVSPLTRGEHEEDEETVMMHEDRNDDDNRSQKTASPADEVAKEALLAAGADPNLVNLPEQFGHGVSPDQEQSVESPDSFGDGGRPSPVGNKKSNQQAVFGETVARGLSSPTNRVRRFVGSAFPQSAIVTQGSSSSSTLAAVLNGAVQQGPSGAGARTGAPTGVLPSGAPTSRTEIRTTLPAPLHHVAMLGTTTTRTVVPPPGQQLPTRFVMLTPVQQTRSLLHHLVTPRGPALGPIGGGAGGGFLSPLPEKTARGFVLDSSASGGSATAASGSVTERSSRDNNHRMLTTTFGYAGGAMVRAPSFEPVRAVRGADAAPCVVVRPASVAPLSRDGGGGGVSSRDAGPMWSPRGNMLSRVGARNSWARVAC